MSLKVFFLTFIILLVLSGAVNGRRFISDSGGLISDGVHSEIGRDLEILRLDRDFAGGEEESCEQSYGFMPCTKTALGNVFLILVYGYLMFLGATYLSSGSELLLEILGPGIIGGLFLPVLGALPDAMLILGTIIIIVL